MYLPAVHEHWQLALGSGGMFRPHPPEEGQYGRGIVRDPMIRPGSEMILTHLQRRTSHTLSLNNIQCTCINICTQSGARARRGGGGWAIPEIRGRGIDSLMEIWRWGTTRSGGRTLQSQWRSHLSWRFVIPYVTDNKVYI